MACVYSLSHLAQLVYVSSPINAHAGPAGMLVFLVALTEVCAVLHWFVARAMERVWPSAENLWRLSANLTWPGAALGVALCVALAQALAPQLTPFSQQHAVWFGALVGVASTCGHLILESVRADVRRSLPLALLPAASHLGGVLERVYGLMYTAPVFFHVARYLYKFQ